MTWIRRPGRQGTAVLAALLALSCGDDGPSGNTGSIQVAVDPAALSVPQGGSGLVTASLTRGGGFSGVVTLAVTGLPTGVTATITPAQLSGTIASATVTVIVAAVVVPETHTATITATAQGVDQATTTYELTVTAAPDYALTVAPTALTIPAGTSGGATVNIERTSFTGGVALAVLDPPAGITGAFDPTPSTTNVSALVVNVAANVAAGAYPLAIQGTATGPGVRTTTLTVTVTVPPTGGTTIEYQFCDASFAPVFFAYQDGMGAWRAVTGSTSSGVTKFVFDLTQGHGGVAIVYRTASASVAEALSAGHVATGHPLATRPVRFQEKTRTRFGPAGARTTARARTSLADTYETEVLYATTAEFAQDAAASCVLTEPTKTVTGTVAGVLNGQYGVVSLGGVTDIFNGSASTNPVTFSGVPEGLVDFVGSRIITPGAAPDRVVVFRNLNVPDGGSLPATIDFNGPASAVPATANATITGGAGGTLEIFVEVVTANSHALLWSDLAPSTNAIRPWAGLSSTTMVSGDFHGLVVFASSPGGGAANSRVSLKYVGEVTPQTIALGATIPVPAISQVAAGAYPRFRFQGTFPSEYDKGAFVDVVSTLDPGNVFSIIATSAYLTASGLALAYDFTMPDVSGLAGFPAAARLTAGPNDVSASAFGFTGPGIFDVRPGVGREFRASGRGASIDVP